jgi:hypothetical protein
VALPANHAIRCLPVVPKSQVHLLWTVILLYYQEYRISSCFRYTFVRYGHSRVIGPSPDIRTYYPQTFNTQSYEIV